MHNYISSVALLCIFSTTGYTQTPALSQSLITYDLNRHTTDKPIPFDRAFTLVLEKFPGTDVTDVHLYEAHLVNGARLLVQNIYTAATGPSNGPCPKFKGAPLATGEMVAAIKDKALRFKSDSAALLIFIDPLKPNKLFDLNVISHLSPANKSLAYGINAWISSGDLVKAQAAFAKLDQTLTDPIIARSYLTVNWAGYQAFYTARLEPFYRFIATVGNFPVVDFLTLEELQAIGLGSATAGQDFKDVHYLAEAIRNVSGDDIQRGLVNISKIYDKEQKTALSFGHLRLQYLQSSVKFFDSLHTRLNWLVGKGHSDIRVGVRTVNLEAVRLKIKTLRERMIENRELLSARMEAVAQAIDYNDSIRQGTYISGHTVSSDLKTAGGTVLFVDAGFAHIVAPGQRDTRVGLPRLYSGVSIYFRPVDKNTRRSSFPRKFVSQKNCGCQANGQCGPDYGVITKTSLWQHLSLTIGFTWGALPNKDFENFYNNTSLLLGPAYRFKRAFKASVGLAFLKRSPENPLVSDKRVVVGQYISLSADIDFIQSIKDITSILFK